MPLLACLSRHEGIFRPPLAYRYDIHLAIEMNAGSLARRTVHACKQINLRMRGGIVRMLLSHHTLHSVAAILVRVLADFGKVGVMLAGRIDGWNARDVL